jgi:hypothetical protein
MSGCYKISLAGVQMLVEGCGLSQHFWGNFRRFWVQAVDRTMRSEQCWFVFSCDIAAESTIKMLSPWCDQAGSSDLRGIGLQQ